MSASVASPLDSNRVYILSVYSRRRTGTGDKFSHASYDSTSWVTIGLAHFSADNHSFHLADHKIKAASWDPDLRALSWSDASEGSARAQAGSVRFSDNLHSFIGTIMASDGEERAIAGIHMQALHTKMAGEDWHDLVFGGTGGDIGFAFLWNEDPNSYDDETVEYGFLNDVSDAYWKDGNFFHFVKEKNVGPSGNLSFDITFSDLDHFEGTFTNTITDVPLTWTGSSFKFSEKLKKRIEDILPTENNQPPPSRAVDIYLPTANSHGNPPHYASDLTVKNLWNISAYRVEYDAMKQPIKGVDIIQRYVGAAANKIYMTSLPKSVKDKFNLSDPILGDTEEEKRGVKEIMDKHAGLNETVAIPFFAKLLIQPETGVATQEQKKHINIDKIDEFFNSLGKPKEKNKANSIAEAFFEREGKDLQDEYYKQMDELYKLYYRLKAADFDQYSSTKAVAQKWFEEFNKFLSSPSFLARWANITADLKFSPAVILMDTSTKLSILEDIGYPERPAKDRKTPNIIGILSCISGVSTHSSSLEFDESLRKQIEEILKTVGELSEKEVREKYPDLLQGWADYQVLRRAFGQTELSEWLLKIMYYYKQEGKTINIGFIQGVSDLISDVWRRLTNGETREGIMKILGLSEEFFELAEKPFKDKTLWSKVKSFLSKKFKPFLSGVAYAGCAAVFLAIASGGIIPVTPEIQVLFGLEGLAYAVRTFKYFASTAVGKLLKEKLLDKNVITKQMAEWFDKKGIVKAESLLPKTLLKLFGKNVKAFLKRLGAVISVAFVVVSAFDLKNALETGQPMEIAQASIQLALAVIDVAIVGMGFIAEAAGWSTLAACTGPIGLAIGLIGFVVALVFFLIEMFKTPVPPDPVGDFIGDELQKAGYNK